MMRRRTRGLIALAGLLACLAAGVAAAQDKPANNMEILREKARADKKVVVAAVLNLTEGEAKAFWPVYNAYQSDMVAHYNKLLKLIDAYGAAYDGMTDETATKLLSDYLALERAHVALLSAYLPKFQKVLPPKKVVRLYQIENKMRALVNYDLAGNIPFVK
ncbi:MAG TPA: hypothetical protein VMQ51_00600 [Candidatus Binatia bacterium]|nr:hypothetical protein [Candidatus Binatia bacterium]